MPIGADGVAMSLQSLASSKPSEGPAQALAEVQPDHKGGTLGEGAAKSLTARR